MTSSIFEGMKASECKRQSVYVDYIPLFTSRSIYKWTVIFSYESKFIIWSCLFSEIAGMTPVGV